MTDTPKFPDNPNHANGTCEDCGEPCHVYGCRWCPACYDAGSARIREASRQQRAGRAQTAAEWADAFKPLGVPLLIEAPAPWQRAALAALPEPARVPATLAGLPLVVDRGVPTDRVVVLGSRLGRTPAQLRAVCLLLDDEVPPCLS